MLSLHYKELNQDKYFNYVNYSDISKNLYSKNSKIFENNKFTERKLYFKSDYFRKYYKQNIISKSFNAESKIFF